MHATATLDTLSATRRAILVALKRRGEARADELAAELGMTASGMRQHLTCLARDGLVEHRELRGGPGRPKHVFELAPAGDALFPRTYGELATELLDHLAEEDADLVDAVFERRRVRRVDDARRRLEGKPLAGAVAELATILDEDGYLAEAEPLPEGGGWRLVERNCPIVAVAARYGQACSSELAFLRAVLPGADVERVSHVMAGQRVCGFEIRPRAAHSART